MFLVHNYTVAHTSHLPDALRTFSFTLDRTDLEAIERVTCRALGPVGDVYAAEREKGGRHAAIMKYNLSDG